MTQNVQKNVQQLVECTKLKRMYKNAKSKVE
jgi:hypothetical protein